MQIPPLAYTQSPVFRAATQNAATPPEPETPDTEGIEEHTLCQCETCRNRRYQDDSPDGGVSFQQPTHIPPNQAAAAVIGHEREHQGREARFAAEDGRDVIINEIRIFTNICPECNRVYVSGGETHTVTRSRPEEPTLSLLDVLSSRQI